MVQSRRKVKTVLSKTGIAVELVYCRKCRENKKPAEFYVATDELLDTNGYMSICKPCCDSIYQSAYRSEKNTARAMLIACRLLNWKFDEDALNSAMLHIETYEKKGKQTNSVLGIYKSKLIANSKNRFSDTNTNVDLTFHENAGLVLAPEDPLEDHEKNAEELKQFWGDSFEYDEYVWLEAEYSQWPKPNNRNEETILKLVILKLLKIRKEINGGNDTTKLEESLSKLLESGGLKPVQANAANQGKNKDCFGEWIKDIEKHEPAEWWKDHSIYKDVDDIAGYWKLHILRPFLNFWGIQKDFDFEGAVETGSSDDSDEKPVSGE